MFNKKAKEEARKAEEALQLRIKSVEGFANVGEYVEYLGVRMLVVGYHTISYCPDRHYIMKRIVEPTLNVQWMSTDLKVQFMNISDKQVWLCKKV